MRWALYDNFEFLTLLLRVADTLGPSGGDQNLKESHHIWSAYFWHDRSPICLPACAANEVLFGTLCQCSGWYWWMLYAWSWWELPRWHPMSLAFRKASSSYQMNKIKQHTGRFEDIGTFDAPYWVVLNVKSTANLAFMQDCYNSIPFFALQREW